MAICAGTQAHPKQKEIFPERFQPGRGTGPRKKQSDRSRSRARSVGSSLVFCAMPFTALHHSMPPPLPLSDNTDPGQMNHGIPQQAKVPTCKSSETQKHQCCVAHEITKSKTAKEVNEHTSAFCPPGHLYQLRTCMIPTYPERSATIHCSLPFPNPAPALSGGCDLLNQSAVPSSLGAPIHLFTWALDSASY
ncbi:hypothetical protein NQZ68_008294 [Dissostichus eleginoides]|nr:hypothetical protein NQZ68_008294 [Dissostichus eleginoides]